MKKDSTLFRNIFGSFTVKGLSIILNFLTMPAYLSYFEDKSILGLWLAIIGVLTWIVNFDLGIGNGLRNKLVKYLDENNMKKAKEYISSAYMMLSFISLIIAFFGYFLIQNMDWNNLFNISSETVSREMLSLVISFTFVGLLLYFVLKLISSILLSMEKVALVNFLQLLTNACNLVYILIIKEENPQIALRNLSFFYIISLNLPYLITTVVLFFGKLRKCRPSIFYGNRKIAMNITFLGGKFFFIQLMLLIINSTNEFFISNIFGPNYVVDYQIYYKVFYLIVTLFSLITNPIWSNIARANSNQDYRWIRNLQKKLRTMSLISALGICIIIFAFPFIVKIWLNNNNFKYNLTYGLVFGLYSIVMIFVLSETAIANGLSRLKVQLIYFTIAGFIKIPLTYFFDFMNFSWIGVVIVNIIILIPLIVAQINDTKKFLIINIKKHREAYYES
ncbi:lipopolysaccharide biosynthesis protein [[Eubacterium] hominis]|uniref:lipopolysaccharide biosynthesis protein n=1 Tax=[Eubacterium] hominis TaxID=2764325 RepID=UPI003A4D6D15